MGGGVPQVAPVHPMLGLPIGGQVPHLQVCVALRAADLLAETFLLGVYLPHQHVAVGLRRVTPKRAARLTRHAHCYGHIGDESHAVKDLRQCV